MQDNCIRKSPPASWCLIYAKVSLQAQTERSDDFKAKYELKEVVVMSRHNIRSPLTSGGAAYMRVTPYEWFKWTSPSSQLSQRGGVLETEMGQFFRKWVVSAGLLPPTIPSISASMIRSIQLKKATNLR